MSDGKEGRKEGKREGKGTVAAGSLYMAGPEVSAGDEGGGPHVKTP